MNTMALMAAAALVGAGRGTPLPDPSYQRPYNRKPLSNRERKLQEKNEKKRAKNVPESEITAAMEKEAGK